MCSYRLILGRGGRSGVRPSARRARLTYFGQSTYQGFKGQSRLSPKGLFSRFSCTPGHSRASGVQIGGCGVDTAPEAWPGGEMRGGEGDREHQGDLRESLLHTTGPVRRPDGDSWTFHGGGGCPRVAYDLCACSGCRIAIVEVNNEVIYRWEQPGKATASGRSSNTQIRPPGTDRPRRRAHDQGSWQTVLTDQDT